MAGFCLFLLSLVRLCNAQATPTPHEIGMILGYPATEIIVQDITAEERVLWSTPTAKERRSAVQLPDSATLIAAYKVVGRDPRTFFSMRIWLGREGTFLNPQSRKILDAIAADPSAPVIRGGKGPFGAQSFGELGDGGIYLGKVKVPSTTKEMTEPQEKAAMISVLHLASQNIDVRIALMAALEGEPNLNPILGGEKYYEAFAALGEDRSEPRYDVAELFRSLNHLAATQALPPVRPQGTVSVPPTKGSSETKSAGGEPAPKVLPSVEAAQQKPRSWIWIAIVAFVVGLALIYKKSR
jgi:hypothetical protein